MTGVTLWVSSTGRVVGDKIQVARNPWHKFWGLMGTPSLPDGCGMLFYGTNAVHSFFMRYPLTLVFLDSEGVIVALAILKPWRIGPWIRHAHYVLELGEGPWEEVLAVGERLLWEKSKPNPGEPSYSP